MTSVGVFSSIANEEQVAELRQYYVERGIAINRIGSADLFENLQELINATGPLVAGLPSEKDVELVLNSLFSLLISFKDDQAHQLVHQFCALLTAEGDDERIFRGQGWNSTAGVAVRVLSNLYHLHADQPDLQLMELRHLMSAAGRARLTRHLDIASVSAVDAVAKRWGLDMEQKRELYRRLHAALVNDERHENAAEVMCTLLKTYTDQDAAKAQADARECVRTTIVDPNSFCFNHLLHLSAVKSLEKTDPLIFEMLGIFVHGSLTDYRRFVTAHPAFVREELRVQDERGLEQKIKQLTLISIAEQKQQIPLRELSTALDIADEEQLEEFLIDAVRANAIQGKIDEVEGQIAVTFYQQRVFGSAQWNQLQQRLTVLLDNLRDFRGNMHSIVAGDEGFAET